MIKKRKKHPDMLPYNELKEEVKEYDRATVKAVLQAQKESSADVNKPNLKPFSLEAAKAGKPVCTRDGRKARIICFDRKCSAPIVALIELVYGIEGLQCVYSDGKCFNDIASNNDLMMLSEKKEGWVNVYKGGLLDTKSYPTKKEAFDRACPEGYVDTVKVCWEE